jgi:ribosomal protein S18 acetylase RimI-like enzyme
MNRVDLQVQNVSANELTACLSWLLGKLRVERAQWVVAQLTARVERKRISDIFAVQSQQAGQINAAAIAIIQHPGAATLLAIGDTTDDDLSAGTLSLHSTLPIDAVFNQLAARLAAGGVQFIQAASESFEQAKQLQRLGFSHLADLRFFVLETDLSQVADLPGDRDCQFEQVGEQESRLTLACELAATTFSGTLDCPRLSDFRSAAEIVEGYRLTNGFDPRLWQILLVDRQPAGCLFLTQHRGTETASQGATSNPGPVIEISYMGLVPRQRGRGLGTLILTEAVRVARQHQAPRMVLAVDRENSPAIALYRRHGWTDAGQETAWGIKIKP